MYDKMFGTDSNGLVTPYVSEIEGTDGLRPVRSAPDLVGAVSGIDAKGF